MKLRCLAIVLCTLPLLAQSPKVERLASAPDGIARSVAVALEAKGYRLSLDDGWSAEVWLAKNLKLGSGSAADALYPQLSNGEFFGVLHLPKGMSDFRGQALPAGTYTLRYQLLPQDANHMGVSPNPDFLLAIPADDDPKPDATYPFEKLVALSAKSTGAHPAVIALEKAGEPGKAAFSDEKMLVLTVNFALENGKSEGFGIVLKGQAAQ